MLTVDLLDVQEHANVIVVLFGEHRILDEATVDRIWGELYGVANREDCHRLLLNFAGVVRLTTTMLTKLLTLRRKMESKGGKLKLCHVDPRIRELFVTTKLCRILDICGSEADALKAFAD